MLKNKLFYFVVFAAAAIFAVTLVGCGEADPKTEIVDKPIALIAVGTASAEARVKEYFDAGNKLVKVVDPANTGSLLSFSPGAPIVLVIPEDCTLDLNGFDLIVGTNLTLVVAGTLSATIEQTQIALSGTIIAFGDAAGDNGIKKYANVPTSVVKGGSNSTAGADAGAAYYLGNISDDGTLLKTAGTLAAVTTVFGNVTLTKADAAPDAPAALAKVYGNVSVTSGAVFALSTVTSITGNLSLTGPSSGETPAAFTVGTVTVDGDASVSGKATLADTALTVVKGLDLGADATLISTAALIKGDLTGTGKVNLVAASGKITVNGTATIADGVTLENGSVANTHSAVAVLATVIPAVIDGTSAVLGGDISVGADGALSVPATKTLTIKSGTLSVKASKSITVAKGSYAHDTAIIVAAGAVLDLQASSAAITLTGDGTAPGEVVLESALGTGAAAPGGGGKILLASTGNTAKAAGAGVAANNTAAVSTAKFTFAGKVVTDWSAESTEKVADNGSDAILKSLEAGTRASAAFATPALGSVTLNGGGSGTGTLSAASTFELSA